MSFLVYFNNPLKYFVSDHLGDNFEVSFDVHHFKPEEISVKITEGNLIIVEGKHEEKKNEDGSIISRHFVRKLAVPHCYDVKKIQSQVYSDGILTITAPKFNSGNIKSRKIPVNKVKSDYTVPLKAKL